LTAAAVPQTFTARILVNQGWHLDPENQFFADAASGLRGYRLHAFEGTGNAIGNAEYRISAGREMLHLVSPGLAAFFDAGTVTGGFRPLGLKCDAGLGIRLALPRSTRNLLRLDVAYALGRDPLHRSGLVVSFSSGSSF
jgi:outer membrane translocation and assembly module TamA